MATSDEQRAAALAHFTEYFVKNYPGPTTIIHDPYWHAPKIFRAAEYALQACAAQQAPQERADELARRLRDLIRNAKPFAITNTDLRLSESIERAEYALAANPQQSNGAVEKPTKEPDAAIGASQVPEGVANAERSAMQLCPTTNPQQIMGESDVCAGGQEQSPRRAGASQVAHPNPQQIASETKGGGERG